MTEQEIIKKYSEGLTERLSKKLDEYIKALNGHNYNNKWYASYSVSPVDDHAKQLCIFKTEERDTIKSEFFCIEDVMSLFNGAPLVHVYFYEKMDAIENTPNYYKNVFVLPLVKNSYLYNKVKCLMNAFAKDIENRTYAGAFHMTANKTIYPVDKELVEIQSFITDKNESFIRRMIKKIVK